MDFKKEIVETVKNYVNDYQNIFIFNYENLKTARFQKIREEWQSSKYVKNKAKLNRVYLFLNLACFVLFKDSIWPNISWSVMRLERAKKTSIKKIYIKLAWP